MSPLRQKLPVNSLRLSFFDAVWQMVEIVRLENDVVAVGRPHQQISFGRLGVVSHPIRRLEAIDGADGRDDLDAVIGSCCGDHVVARKRRCSALRYALDEPPHVRFPR